MTQQKPRIVFYSYTDSPRVRYVMRWLSDFWSVPIHHVRQDEFMQADSEARLYYGPTPIKNAVCIPAEGRLNQGAPPYRLADIIQDRQPPFDPTLFDVLSAIFCMLARTEEYLPFKPDEHNRFTSASDSACRLGYTMQPMADIWAIQLAQILTYRYPFLKIQFPKPTTLPTFDVDTAFFYQARGLIKNTYNKLRFALQHKQYPTAQRDPFNTYDYIFNAIGQQRSCWFWLVAKSHPPYNPTVNVRSKKFLSLIQSYCSRAVMGIHPSYYSFNNKKILSEEIKTLSEILSFKIVHSRQHYLRMRLPATYRLLIDAGITHDYSMGYADTVGFRAGTSRQFFWYDLEKDCETQLTVQPFIVMDVALKNYMHLTPHEAQKLMHQLRQTVIQTYGCWSFVWHNTNFVQESGWYGWNDVFLTCVEPL